MMETLLNKQLKLICFLIIFSITSNAQTWQWAKRVGSSGDNDLFATGNQDEKITDLVVDKVGNMYATGSFFGGTVFNNSGLFGQTPPANFAKRDAYLVKYSSCGKTLWYRRMGGNDDDEASSLAIDKSGRLVITGYCTGGPNTFGDGTNDTVINGGVQDMQFLAYFDTSGNFIKAKTYPYSLGKILINSQGNYVFCDGLNAVTMNTLGVMTNSYNLVTTTPFYPNVTGVTIDRNDNIYICGAFNNTVNIGPGTILAPTPSTIIPNQNANNSLIMKFSAGGNLLWHKRSTSSGGGDILNGCTVDTSGNTVATGGTAANGTNLFGYLINGNVGNTANDMFILSALNGNFVVGKTGSRNYQGTIYPFLTDRDNNFHCIGGINGFLAFNTTTYTSVGGSANRQLCIGKFDTQGNFIDINLLPQMGSNNGKELTTAMDISEQGNLYIGGMFGGTLDSANTAVNIIGGTEDGFVAKFGFACGSNSTNLSPLPPTNLAAQYQATLTNNVVWVDNSNFETAYELWVMPQSASNYSLLATLPANATTYTHSGLSYTTTYCYKARAVDPVGPSYYTNIACATTPSAPTSNTTGIAELNYKQVLNVYPNPTSGNVILQYTATGKTTNIEVTNQLGECIFKKQVQTSAGDTQHKIELPNTKGLYFVSLSSEGQRLLQKVVVE